MLAIVQPKPEMALLAMWIVCWAAAYLIVLMLELAIAIYHDTKDLIRLFKSDEESS